MKKRSNIFKPGDLVEVWSEELKYMGAGVYISEIDQETEWDLAQGGDCWVFMGNDSYVFWSDELEKIDPKRKILKIEE
jgi:hypothetical protein